MNLEAKPMDRHKIGAVMIYSILKSQPFHVNRRVPNLPVQLLMANEYLAFHVALNIVELYKIDDSQLEENKDLKDNLILPETYHGDVYIENVCRALYYVKSSKDFDIFAYADLLFLLEKYNDIYLEYKGQEK